MPSRSPARTVALTQVRNGDRGFKVAATSSGLTVTGTAAGPRAAGKEPIDDDASLGFAFDHDKMPKFDTSAGFEAKNAWYFSHTAELTCARGQTPGQVLEVLAQKINAVGDYRASVSVHGDGSATLAIDRR
jgi:hypothetical protein